MLPNSNDHGGTATLPTCAVVTVQARQPAPYDLTDADVVVFLDDDDAQPVVSQEVSPSR